MVHRVRLGDDPRGQPQLGHGAVSPTSGESSLEISGVPPHGTIRSATHGTIHACTAQPLPAVVFGWQEINLRGFEQQWLQIASAVSLAAPAPALVAVVGAA